MESTFIDLVKNQLVGKKLRHKNQYNREVVLEVENIKVEHGSRDLEPSTAANDWWPAQETWTNYYVCFVDGSKISFSASTKFDIVE